MPVSYGFDEGIITLRLVGEYTSADVRACLLDALCESPPAPQGLLVDLRDSSSIELRSLSELTATWKFVALHAARFGQRAATLVHGHLAYGVARMGEVDLTVMGVENRVFRDAAEAHVWLRDRSGEAVAT